jgi:hypothetical protein
LLGVWRGTNLPLLANGLPDASSPLDEGHLQLKAGAFDSCRPLDHSFIDIDPEHANAISSCFIPHCGRDAHNLITLNHHLHISLIMIDTYSTPRHCKAISHSRHIGRPIIRYFINNTFSHVIMEISSISAFDIWEVQVRVTKTFTKSP